MNMIPVVQIGFGVLGLTGPWLSLSAESRSRLWLPEELDARSGASSSQEGS
jgi:hypothetical protein